MGIENRDYFRDASRRDGGIAGAGGYSPAFWPPVCKWILIVTVGVFLLQIFVTRPATVDDIPLELQEELAKEPGALEDLVRYSARVPLVQEALALKTDSVLKGQVWRLITTAFLHDRMSVFHILFNMLFLVWFGRTLERMYGSREFLAFYLVAAVGASLAFMGIELATGERHPAIGASGAIMAVVMLYAIHFPREEIRIFFMFPIQIRFVVLFYIIFDLHPLLLSLAGDRYSDGIAHSAHLGGLLFGFLYHRRGWRLGRLLGKGGREKIRVPKKRSAQQRRKAMPQEPKKPERVDPLGYKIDEILQKISDDGMESLSDEERRFLEHASEQYRDKDKR